MSGSATDTGRRRARAARALDRLGSHRSDHQKVRVQCGHSHHLAAVYLTDEGPVYVSRTGPHSHGSKDFIDTGSAGARGGIEYVDLLDAGLSAEDELPAWCDCGSRTLSRQELLTFARAGVPTVRLE